METKYKETWDSWNEKQKYNFSLKAHENDKHLKKISAEVDSISSYSTISRITKNCLKKMKNEK